MAELLKKNLHDWLYTALAMEVQAEELFDAEADRLGKHPVIQAKLENEANLSRNHQKILSNRIQQLGNSSASIKATTDRAITDMPNMLEMTMSDAPVKIILALYTFSEMEISSIKIIAKAAEVLNDYETVKVSEHIYENLSSRLKWMSAELNKATHEFFSDPYSLNTND